MEEKPKVYIETSVVSYLVARPSKDLIVAAHQQITYDWWHDELPKFQPFVSESVIKESARGDEKLAQERLELIGGFYKLKETENIYQLASVYLERTKLPEKCRVDCIHMATASVYRMDFMASWNCKHIVNGMIINKIKEINDTVGVITPGIRTPEELYGDLPS